MKVRQLPLLTVTFVLLGSALSVVYIKHQTRVLYGDVRDLQQQRDQLDREWGRLQLQWSTLAAHARVERLAHEQLHMQQPLNSRKIALR